MKKLLLIFLLLVFIFPVYGEIIHNIKPIEDKLLINSTIILRSDEKLDYWKLKLMLPKNTEIIELRDEIGRINYNFSDNKLEFKTNRKKAKIRIINLTFKKDLKEEYGFKIAELSLFGFKNDTTILISPHFQYFFAPDANVEYGEKIKAKKTGAMYIRIIFGGKKESKHYFTNSNLNLSLPEKYYWIPEGITGLKVPVKFGIVSLSGDEYNITLEKWSSGTYDNGIIFIREEEDMKDKIATIMHETTHGINSFALDWDKTNISWFDEGVACYVTAVVYRMLNKTRPQIFGKDVRWRKGGTTYILKSNLKPEDLFNYYRKGENWVSYWYPAKYKDEYRREFGYAYSELFIREYLKENGSALHKVYQNLLKINKSVENEIERNGIILHFLGKKFKPCYSLNLDKIKNCTDDLNEMSFEVPISEGKEINYEIEVPELPKTEDNSFALQKFFDRIIEFFSKLISGLFKQ